MIWVMLMNDRDRKIDDFLKFFRDIALQNPDYRLSHNNVYSQLTFLGVSKNEQGVEINQFFSNWIEYFENNERCIVKVEADSEYFCQFISSDEVASEADEHLKIYVPLDSAHIERGAKEIFEFLSRERISHVSKIGSHVRFDDIVIRLINIDDVIKLVNFINNNEYIQEGLMPANPFGFNHNGIAMTVDGSLSFNSTVASLIQFYINDKIEKNLLDTVGVDDFYLFVQNYYDYTFASAQGLKDLARNFSENCCLSDEDIINYRNVFKFLLKVRNKDFSLGDYVLHFIQCSSYSVRNANYVELDMIRSGQVFAYMRDEDKEIIIERTNKFLLRLFDEMNKKYNDMYLVLNDINHYILTGNINYIPSIKNLRNMVQNSSFKKDINDILNYNCVSFIDYAQSLLNDRNNQVINEDEDKKLPLSVVEKSVILTIKELIVIVSEKFSFDIFCLNLRTFLKTGSPLFFPPDYDLRNRIVNSSFREDLMNILESRGISLDEYINDILGISIDNSEFYLEQAILETYSKYEKIYQEGNSNFSGINIVVNSLVKLIFEGDYTGFITDNNIRMNLKKNVSVSEVIRIVKRFFSIDENIKLSNEDFCKLLEEYVNLTIGNNVKKL